MPERAPHPGHLVNLHADGPTKIGDVYVFVLQRQHSYLVRLLMHHVSGRERTMTYLLDDVVLIDRRERYEIVAIADPGQHGPAVTLSARP